MEVVVGGSERQISVVYHLCSDFPGFLILELQIPVAPRGMWQGHSLSCSPLGDHKVTTESFHNELFLPQQEDLLVQVQVWVQSYGKGFCL